MASSPFPLNYLNRPSACPSSTSLYLFILNPQTNSSKNLRTLKFKCSCSHETIQLDTQQINFAKKKRKPRPSFFEQIQDKWCLKTTSSREKFPWQEQEQGHKTEPIEEEEEEESRREKSSGFVASQKTELDKSSPVSFNSVNRSISAPWDHGSKPKKPQFDSDTRNSQNGFSKSETLNGFRGNYKQELKNSGIEANYSGNGEGAVKIGRSPNGLSEKKEASGQLLQVKGELRSNDEIDSMRLPWKRESDVKTVGIDGERLKNSNTKVAEDTIPETELKRLRNVALRMVERIKVGAAGVTQALVDSIHDKWEISEVVKLKFEGPPAMNMKRTHEILESRTGGLVIWRSGSSVVLYRGMTYKLHCVQSYTKQIQESMNNSHSSEDFASDMTQRVGLKDSVRTTETLNGRSARYLKALSEEELKDLSELNHLLDELGPRYVDWSGRDPLPVDADLLPALVRGYKRPFRVLPYGIRHGLRDKEMTFFRRTARTMPPHFALGRNRELEGLGVAMVKLWERSAIAKIAIKRGVHNTCNERMAEELKRLTGGTLVSRNKDYIVFYRGNDFLPPGVSGTLAETQTLIALRQDGEEQTRQNMSTLIGSNHKAAKSPLVAGTLAETMAATSRWGNQPSNEEREKMMRDLALARHASLVKHLENKLSLAKGKIKKAEKALEKVQEYLEPAELPTDLETISDEERFLFRKIGLSMKPYLLLGRRGMFDGTIENMHLHWKYREVVKIIVERSSFSQLKHTAISLEAESGGVLVSLDKTTKGYAIIFYRGKNYQRPQAMRPKNLLTKRQALARSIELQRREALKHHLSNLQEEIEKLKSELEEMKTVDEIDEETLKLRVDITSDDEMEEDEGEEAYLEVYDSGNEDGDV